MRFNCLLLLLNAFCESLPVVRARPYSQKTHYFLRSRRRRDRGTFDLLHMEQVSEGENAAALRVWQARCSTCTCASRFLCCVWSIPQRHDPRFDGVHGKADPAFHIEFGEQGVPVIVHGTGADAHFQGDFLIGQVGAGQLQEKQFVFG